MITINLPPLIIRVGNFTPSPMTVQPTPVTLGPITMSQGPIEVPEFEVSVPPVAVPAVSGEFICFCYICKLYIWHKLTDLSSTILSVQPPMVTPPVLKVQPSPVTPPLLEVQPPEVSVPPVSVEQPQKKSFRDLLF